MLEYRSFIVYEYHRNLPYGGIKDTGKIAHSIIQKHKYTYKLQNTEYFLSLSLLRRLPGTVSLAKLGHQTHSHLSDPL